MSKAVSIWNYGNYSSDNYGSCRAVSVGSMDFYFSYNTVIAFRTPQTGLVVRKNVWGNTTGKHLNWIDGGDKAQRIDGVKFEEMLDVITSQISEAMQKVNTDLWKAQKNGEI